MMTRRLGIVVLGLLAGCGGAPRSATPVAAAPAPVEPAPAAAAAAIEPQPADPAVPGDTAAPAAPADPADPADGAAPGSIGIGAPGTIGQGSGTPGGSRYAPRANAPKAGKAPAPTVIPGIPQVRGALDKELIRRIIRRHIKEVEFCYETELTRNPGLQGRIMTQFTIAPTGAVATAIIQSSTLGNALVEQCVARAVRRWEFPKPQGGVVVVSYPFVLKGATQ